MTKIVVFLMIFITGCNNMNMTTPINKVLKVNPSLEKVLHKYSSDSLKYLAAKFLIENLDSHYGYSEEQIKPYLKMYELFGTGKLSIEEAEDSVKKLYPQFFYTESKEPISDTKISSEYLIDNIEWAFKVWHEQPWGKNVSFEDFCEYILPYRIKDEPLKAWRERLYKIYNPMLNNIRNMPEASDPLFAARVLRDSISKQTFHFSSALGNGPHVGPDIIDWNSGNCREVADKLTYIFRAVGIPCGCDYMPLRGDGNVAHYWNFVLDKNGDSYAMYDISEPIPIRSYWGIKSKIYRKTYSLNKDISRIVQNVNKESIYPSFRYSHFKDVTQLYSGKYARKLIISNDCLFEKPANNIIYLCGASWLGWLPLAIANISENTISFKDVEGGVVFILAMYKNNRIIPISDPFEFDKETGGIHFFKASNETSNIILLNKFHQFIESFPQRMINGVFEGSNNPDFKTKDTLYIIKELPIRLHNVIYPQSTKNYRYIRYYGPLNSHCNIADFLLFRYMQDTIPLKGYAIGTPNGKHGNRQHDYTNAHDNNSNTSFDYYLPSGGWTGLDLGKPYSIKKIIFTPRNRDNYIRKGDLYELYYNKRGRWISAGKKIAPSDSIIYTVPKEALYYLKNWTEGKDERIFEYYEGKQRYW